MSSLVEAKNMYLRKLVQILSPEIYSGFKRMYKEVESFCKQNQLKEIVAYFQKELEKIPNWSRDRITEETMKIQEKSDCDYLTDIITTLLMVNMKILLDSDTIVDLEVPQLYMFVHKCYKLIGAELWSNPELMADNGTSSERQKNYTFVMKLIQQGINDAIQFYLPMKPILNRYLRNRDNVNEQQEEYGNISLSDEDDEDADEISSMTVEVEENKSTFFDDADDIALNDE